jgi:lysozyme
MKSAGLIRGAYWFFHPELDPTTQAKAFLSALSQAGGLSTGDLPPVADMEITGGTSAATIQGNLQTWLNAVQAATGTVPMIYTSISFADTDLGTGFGNYPLWIANYGVSCPHIPAGWSTWAFWQNSGSGTVAGIGTTTDLDVFNGTLAQLTTFAAGN